MLLSKEFLDEEIERSKIAIEKLEQGLALNELILKAFQEELKNAH